MPKINKRNLIIYLAIFLAFSLGGKLIHTLVDFLWFKETGFSSFYLKSLYLQFGLGVAGAAIMGSFLFLNHWLAERFSRRAFVIIEPNARVSAPFPIPHISDVKPLVHVAILVGVFLASFIAGGWCSNQWEVVLKFLNAVAFNMKDPLFGKDIGFYVFTLPFYKFIYYFSVTTEILAILIVIATYLVNNRIHVTERGMQMADNAKAHILFLTGMLFLLVMFHFQIKMFDLLSVQRQLAPGAGFSSVHATLPGLKVLRFAAFLSALFLLSSPWFTNTKVTLGAVIALVAGTLIVKVYAEGIQKFTVGPNEIVKETPFINLAIENTRQAYGLAHVQELEFDPKEMLTLDTIKKNDLTVKNIRLWESRPLLTSYGQLQEIRTYYDFLDVDNDRYMVNGEYRQVMVSARELVPESIPSRNWINEHLTYTHGYGICLGPVNRISPEGLPEFFIKDIPPASTVDLKVTRPEIYFGESRTNYAIVNSEAKEFSYPSGDENVYSDYAGSGGVPVKNFLRRILFALHFGELKIIFARDLRADSRFLYYRSINERLKKAAPFIHFDSDPYIVISSEGKLFWIVDGFTATDAYPYSEQVSGINYIRNSVKATVDAYNGTISLYVSDPKDPIIQTYMKIFPKSFKPIAEMPKDLLAHIRYPQTLLNIQARIYATYHMMDPQVFYNKEDLWKIPLRTAGGRSEPMEPYYTIMKLANIGSKEEFLLMIPFTPAKKENMISWMAARCDEPNYGKLLVYNFPKQKLVYGPQQIESRIDQDAEISKQLTLWDQSGSRVLRGSVLVIPVDQSLLYIQPLYLEASGGGLPELKRIIVAYGNNIAMEENLELSLSRIFGGKVGQISKDSFTAAQGTAFDTKSLIRQARELYDRAQKSARQGDWAGYGEEMKSLEKTLKSLAEQK